MGLIVELGKVEAQTKNGQVTPLYGFTLMGYVIAWLLEYDYDPSERNIAKRAIFDLVQLLLTQNFNSSITDFLTRFYAKCMEKDLEAAFLTRNNAGIVVGRTIIDYLIITFIRVLSSGRFHFPKAIEYFSKAQEFLLTGEETREMTVGLYLEALDECSNMTRKNVMALEKAEIESGIVVSQPSRDWEEKYHENINNYDTLVLYGVCQNKKCIRRYYPVLINFYYYRRKIVSKTDFNYFTEDCVYCNTKNNLYVFNSYDTVRLYMI